MESFHLHITAFLCPKDPVFRIECKVGNLEIITVAKLVPAYGSVAVDIHTVRRTLIRDDQI